MTETKMDSIGTVLTVHWRGRTYRGVVARHGRKYPQVTWTIRNGKTFTRAAYVVTPEPCDPLLHEQGVQWRIPNTYPAGTVLCCRRVAVPSTKEN